MNLRSMMSQARSPSLCCPIHGYRNSGTSTTFFSPECCRDCRSASNTHQRDLYERIALPGKRGFYASFQYVTFIELGPIACVTGVLHFEQGFPTAHWRAWGCRIPFFERGSLRIVAFVLEGFADPTSSAESRSRKRLGSLRDFHSSHRHS